MLSHADKQEQVQALTTRFITGELSEVVYAASLKKYCNAEEVRTLVMDNRAAHRESLPYRRGDVS